MTIQRYLINQKVFFFIQAVFFITLSVMMKLFGVDNFIIGYIICIGIFCEACIIIHDYLRKYKFYQQIERNINTLDQKYMISEMISEPEFLEGQLLYEYLSTCNKSMNDEILKYKEQALSYREYIEMWIHEVKTPIAAVELIIDNYPLEIKNSIKDEIQKIGYYLDQALYYARSTGVEKDYIVKELNLQTVVENEIKSNARMLITSKIKLEIDHLDYAIYTDEKWTSFILKQVIVNAVKYRKDENAKIKFWAEERTDKVILHIEDNGIGISKKDLPKVMEKGYTGTTGRKYAKSTGMGLYLCKELAQKLGISFKINSEEDVGTCASIGFPRNSMTFLNEKN